MSKAEASSGSVAPAELRSLLCFAGISAATQTGWMQVTGTDRVRWLNGMVSNSIQQLTPGAGCYNFILNAQGRIQGDGYAFMEPEQILLRTDLFQVESLMALLDRFIIMDDVEVRELSPEWSGLHLVGPDAEDLLKHIGIVAQVLTPGVSRLTWRTREVTVVRVHAPLVPRFELWAEPATAGQLSEALIFAGANPVTAETLEQLRLLQGTPRYGIDIRDRELPQETGQTQALHFAKGCYLGQEIVERIRSRGAVHRMLTGLRLEGEMPGSDRLLYLDGKKVGELTSSSEIALPPKIGGTIRLALGYVSRENLDADGLTYSGGTASLVGLPYAPARQYASKLLREGHHV